MKSKFYFPIILLSLFLSFYEKVTAQSPNWIWAKNAGGTNRDEGNSVATDAGGNVFMTGNFASLSITFGTTTLTNAGDFDVFIVKYDPTGNVLWAKSAGGASGDAGISVSVDAGGNVFMTGSFGSQSITFGTTTLTNADNTGNTNDIFIVKYDASGNVLWAKSEGSAGDDYGYSVSSDTIGNVFMTGWFQSPTITFGTTILTNAGFFNDIFIVKYDSGGNVLWAKSSGGTDQDFGLSVSTDEGGNVFMTGYFASLSITFGTTTLTNAGSGSSIDIFIVKYDSGGNVLWAKGLGGASDDGGSNVSTDAGGNVFMTGSFASPAINFGTTTLTNVGNSDIFIVKCDSSGNIVWARSAGGVSGDAGISVSADAGGNVFMTGYFLSSVITFGTTTLTNAGYNDIFIVKYDSSGYMLWAKSAGSIEPDISNSVSTDAAGNVFITGYFKSPSITFGTTTLINAGGGTLFPHDIFIAKLDTVLVSGLASNQSSNIVYVFPNPAKNVLTINYQLLSNEDLTITITDITGKIIYQTTTSSTEKLDINTSTYAEGVYLVRVQTKDFIETKKVIIAK